MSEVVGYLLVFGILSFVLVVSMLAFNVASEAARDNAAALRAESAAARVAGVIVQSAVLAEQESASQPAIAYRIDLPDQLEGRDYVVRLESAGSTTLCDPEDGSVAGAGETATADQVCVVVESIGVGRSAPLFSASAPANIDICDSSATGGLLQVRFDDHGTCPGGRVIFLEAA